MRKYLQRRIPAAKAVGWKVSKLAWRLPNRVKALGLGDKYVVKFAGGADAIWAELASAKKESRGIITFNWTPNFTDADGFVFIEFPPYHDGCRIVDGGDGSCGSPKGWLKKAANYKFPKTHPAAYKAFSKLSFTTTQIGQMAALVGRQTEPSGCGEEVACRQ